MVAIRRLREPHRAVATEQAIHLGALNGLAAPAVYDGASYRLSIAKCRLAPTPVPGGAALGLQTRRQKRTSTSYKPSVGFSLVQRKGCLFAILASSYVCFLSPRF